ncbi:hypothetical protein KZO01_17410 [Kurthia zopfii]|uniref:Ribosomal N-acetyltransferase YdaF n=1 Tax=Kurthia zopfii TaxID=1650 RepID=A0A8B4Q4R2_9BACL|nr:UDP-4-amino-4,6-dideoxy-N-acetyl-beta-L-altrosamine N-acetyltransferase [Kurthia zopfii]PWI22646.1 UDP-4-amino-4,6-dideoxy-N-acetyl-beta-L-altrosamine N-acetyltransferase [Kurthia zopfii]TDR39252.1 UDP-4-amino-4,6-dideoxy-N-acetyl-beta-L-altrosamine N-acetyltransferase [Kurthia zopfii]GEK31432.1 hypothetical protein KZO01_17410 [Kurthia zopfii]STX08797.1 Putative ribosomal N-acetyltransferase YdaF [Kurthia zopfii]
MLTFKKMTLLDADEIFQWRKKEHVTKYMYTNLDEDKNKHLKWVRDNIDSKENQYYVIYSNDVKIGLISLNEIDYRNNRASSGFYIGDQNYSLIASRILPYFLNYAFFEFNLNKIVIEVMSNNLGMKKMDLHYGFREVGILQDHIYKDEKYYDVEILELTKKKWNTMVKFHSLIASFE